MSQCMVLQVATTVGSPSQAEELAGKLLDERLAACIQVSGPIQSHFTWKGEQCHEPEYLCTIKTRLDAASRVSDYLDEVHPYETPEVLMIEVKASQAYYQWLQDQVDGG